MSHGERHLQRTSHLSHLFVRSLNISSCVKPSGRVCSTHAVYVKNLYKKKDHDAHMGQETADNVLNQ